VPFVQQKTEGTILSGQGHSSDEIPQIAEQGVRTAASSLPHGERVQQLFGRHDIGQVHAHLGSEAAASARAIQAAAYTSGADIVFARMPDLQTVAHEATHVLQQRSGARPAGGTGQEADQYEREAEAVAGRVAAGRSAQDLLDHLAGEHAPVLGGPGQESPARSLPAVRPAVQRKLDVSGIGRFDALLKAVRLGGSDELQEGIKAAEEGDKFDLRIRVIPKTDPELKQHGDTAIYSGIFLGKGDEASLLLDELVRTNPEELLSPKSRLAIEVTVYEDPNASDAHQAATLIHELELHVVPAFDLVNTIVTMKEQGKLEPVVETILNSARAPDEHRDVNRLINYLQTAYNVAEKAKNLRADLVKEAAGDVINQFLGYERQFLQSITDPKQRSDALNTSLASMEKILSFLREKGLTYKMANLVDVLMPSPQSSSLKEEGVAPEKSRGEESRGEVLNREAAKKLVVEKVLVLRESLVDICEDIGKLGVSKVDIIYFYNEYAMEELALLATAGGIAKIEDFVDFAKDYKVEVINVIYYCENHRFPRPKEKVEKSKRKRKGEEKGEEKRKRS
jgi:hypothetical protein